MTIKAEKVGRDLHITPFEGVDPFVVRPLPGSAGVQITNTYLHGTVGLAPGAEVSAALQMAFDGARKNAITDLWEPLPEAEQTNWKRMGDELSQEESESVLMPAFFWQTVLGMDGVKAYISGGEGLSGVLKATGALTARLGRLAPRTSPRESPTA